MKTSIVAFISACLLWGCQSDTMLKKQLPGVYRMTLATTESLEQLEQMEREIQKRERDSLGKMRQENATDDDSSELDGSKRELMKALIKLKNSLAMTGVKLTEVMLHKLAIRLTLHPDGTAYLGSGLIKKEMRWTVEGGKLYLWGPNEDKFADCNGYSIKKVGTRTWDLYGCDLDFHLEPISNEDK